MVTNDATISVRSLSPLGERAGVRGLPDYRETLTPHPTPLPMGEGADRASVESVPLLPELGQDLGDLLLAVDHLGEKADAVDLAGIVPGRLDQDRRLVGGRNGQPVHRLGEALAIELAELLLRDVFDRVDAGVALDA